MRQERQWKGRQQMLREKQETVETQTCVAKTVGTLSETIKTMENKWDNKNSGHFQFQWDKKTPLKVRDKKNQNSGNSQWDSKDSGNSQSDSKDSGNSQSDSKDSGNSQSDNRDSGNSQSDSEDSGNSQSDNKNNGNSQWHRKASINSETKKQGRVDWTIRQKMVINFMEAEK